MIAETQRENTVAVLCDSLYTMPFHLTAELCEQLLTVCAIDAAHASLSAFACEWGCFLVGIPE